MEKIISIENLTKTFGQLTALDKITFNVRPGIIFGLVGPDGAGKTTLIRILCGLLKADSGNIEILGKKLSTGIADIKNDIGYLSQKFSLYTDLSVDENIDFIADIHGMKDIQQRKEELLNFTRLTNFRKFQAGKLSGGMKQKLALACTLIYKPKIIFLDEPTTGVDPVSRREFWVILSNLLNEGITIIISTPYMDEAERFNELALIDNGKLLTVDSPDNIKSMMQTTILEIVCRPIRDGYKILRAENIYEVQMFGDRLNVIANTLVDIEDPVRKLLKKNNIEISDIRKISPSLENVYIHLIREENKAESMHEFN